MYPIPSSTATASSSSACVGRQASSAHAHNVKLVDTTPYNPEAEASREEQQQDQQQQHAGLLRDESKSSAI